MTAQLKGHARTVAAAAGALLLIAAGYLVLGGTLDRWTEQQMLDDACDGMLAGDEARSLLGDGPISEKRDRAHSEGGLGEDADSSLYVRCVIQRTGEPPVDGSRLAGSVDVAVYGVPTMETARGQRAGSLYWGTQSARPVPLGGGWTGFLSGEADQSAATAAVLLDCPDSRSDLLVALDADVRAGALDNPEHRLRVARLATATAEKAAERSGCHASLGEPLRTVPLPTGEDESVPVARAKGTCAGVPGLQPSIARAWESARGDSPRERCELGDRWRGEFVLDAYYGPYAEDMRFRLHHDSVEGGGEEKALTFSAECAPGEEPALFVLQGSVFESEKEREKYGKVAPGRAALKAFAERSAQAHECSPPVSP
ncbi:hypothetical protein AB0M39_00605 [Streptomyces sp. NPDC051907]|uniref:hypothetical protein n=1 Tax=Streptomyces sp. NPDC051907 TaxID=3155284 RepID=UPI00344199A7